MIMSTSMSQLNLHGTNGYTLASIQQDDDDDDDPKDTKEVQSERPSWKACKNCNPIVV